MTVFDWLKMQNGNILLFFPMSPELDLSDSFLGMFPMLERKKSRQKYASVPAWFSKNIKDSFHLFRSQGDIDPVIRGYRSDVSGHTHYNSGCLLCTSEVR